MYKVIDDVKEVEYTDIADVSESSALRALLYDTTSQSAYVVFQSDNSVWKYEINDNVWIRWNDSDSAGRFYTNVVKGMYDSQYLDDLPSVEFVYHPMMLTAEKVNAKHAKVLWGPIEKDINVTATARFTTSVESLPEYVKLITDAIAGSGITVEFNLNA
jgi:hypothetical protein